MSKTKYLVISSVVVAALAATPLFVSQKVDSTIEANKTLLEKNGFKQEILSKSGYLSSKRAFSLEVTDAKKARDFLLAQLVEKNAQYKLFAQSLQEESNEGINQAFDGLKFKGEMTNSNLLPSDVKVSLSLDQLPKSIQEELANDKAASDVILPLLARGVLAVDMTFTSDQKLKDLTLKDIKEEIKAEGATLNIDTEKQLLSLNERGGVVQGVLGVGKQNLGVSGEMFLLKSELKDFIYNFNYKDDLNNQGDISIGKYALEINDEYTNLKFDLGSLKAKSSVEDVKKDLQIKADYTLDNIALLNSADDIKLEKMFAKLFLRGINSDTMKKVQADYNTLLLGTTPIDDKVLIDDFVALVNHGVKALRKDGYLIANIYGKGMENISAAFKRNEYIKYLKNKTTLAFDIKVDGKVLSVVVKEYQKCPITSDLLHVDLMVAQKGVRASYFIPVVATGSAKGLKNKGLLMLHTRRIPVKCTIENLPNNITLDVTNLDTGDNILLRDITLPENVDCYLDPRVPIVGVIKAK
jgi:ribosomal protein bL25 (Ctc-form)